MGMFHTFIVILTAQHLKAHMMMPKLCKKFDTIKKIRSRPFFFL